MTLGSGSPLTEQFRFSASPSLTRRSVSDWTNWGGHINESAAGNEKKRKEKKKIKETASSIRKKNDITDELIPVNSLVALRERERPPLDEPP